MAENKFDNAILMLQRSPDAKATLNALISIRNEVAWPANRLNIDKFRKKGCLKHLKKILAHSNLRSQIDLALSILGNCLMDRACTREAVSQHNVMSVLNQLLERFPKEDSINGRIFRVVGNICQHKDQWGTLIIERKPFIVTHIVAIINRVAGDELLENEKISEATVITALRALRVFLNTRTIEVLVKEFGALRAVGALFIKYSIQWQEHKQNEKILLDIIRVIQEYSRFKCYHSIIEMRNTERGDSLIYLSGVLVLAPRRIVKIVMNFIRCSQLLSEIPLSEICSKFIEVLDKHSIVKEFIHCTEYLHCLCYLLDYPANRNSTRGGVVIPLLIKALREMNEVSNKMMKCSILILDTLNKFKYDTELLAVQLQQDIIPVLVDKLSWVVGLPTNLKHGKERKRKYVFSPSLSDLIKKRKELKYDVLKECSSSPSSSDSELSPTFNYFNSGSRCSSPCTSSDGESVAALSWSDSSSTPERTLLLIDSDSDNYSPVCSEVDESEFPLPEDVVLDSDLDVLPPVQDIEGSLEQEEEADTDQKDVLSSLKINLVQEIVRLLKTYERLRPLHPHLARPDLLIQLTKCALTESVAKQLLVNILRHHEFVIPIMMSDYIENLYQMRIPYDSSSKSSVYEQLTTEVLNKFCETAESGRSKGEIAHKLLRGDENTKKKLALVIPFIIRDRSILAKLMLNCGGLDILTKLFLNVDDSIDHQCLKGLCKIASLCTLIFSPVNGRSLSVKPRPVTDIQYKVPENSTNLVHFKFDDGSTIAADRDFLIRQSDYFSGLLNGHFKESDQDEILLRNVETSTFSCLLYLLSNVSKSKTTVVVDLDLDTLLDVILLCDRYLLSELCLWLTVSVQQFHISSNNMPKIYKWSIESGTNLLRVESLTFALVRVADERERYKLFKSLFDSVHKEQLIEDMHNLLKKYLLVFNKGDSGQKAENFKSEGAHLSYYDC